MLRRLDEASKRQAARQRIEEMIRGQNLWGRRLKGERALAAELGIARRTLQAALAELQAERLVERRHGAGTFAAERPASRSPARTVRLAVIVSGHVEGAPEWSYTAEILRGVLDHAPKLRAEAQVFALSEPAEAAQVRDAARMRGFDAFISVAENDRRLITHLLRLRRGPVVLLDDVIRDLPVTCVVNASFEGARAVARHLVALGHRRIAFLDCYGREAVNSEKSAGSRSALEEKGLAFCAELVHAPEANVWGPELEAFADRAVERLLALPDPPTAVFGFDDHRALAAAAALERRGRRAGRDFSVAGYGDSAFRRGGCDWLTSCRTYPRKIGQEGVRAALSGAVGQEGRTVIVPDRLYIRRSTCPPVLQSCGGLRSPGEQQAAGDGPQKDGGAP